ncbi:MAG: NAD(P)/FAD-dependent oxidoreductase [Tissierellia bacterium]|nr:NAD(P)/FAD-dependent oxidoreductase [Tissierellia bacterium]
MIISIIGGGPAGIMSAITSKIQNPDCEVILFEKNNRIGKKLLATGNGRCNYTNSIMKEERFHSTNEGFYKNILDNFDLNDTLEFFEGIGIHPYYEENGKIFPNSLQSSSILDTLRYEMNRLQVVVREETNINSIKKKNGQIIIGDLNGNVYYTDRLILAMGGCAMPSSGSDGSGYELAKSIGHSLIRPFPGIVQLNIESPFKNHLNGVRIVSNVKLIGRDGKILRDEFGDLLFTSYGVSGPTVLDISRKANEELNSGREVYVSINLLGDISQDKILNILETRMANLYYKSIEESFVGLIHKKAIIPLLKYSNIDKKLQYSDLDYDSLKKLAKSIYDFRFKITSSQGFENAQVSCGGIDTKEINEYTLESKKMEGVFFAGEIVDVDGDCGGFNLQWAWSSGFTAGSNAVKS